MKRLSSILIALFLATMVYSQKAAEPLNKSLSAAEKKTVELSNIYQFTPEQAMAVKKIQENKYDALVKIEKLKAVDMEKFVAKRLSAFGTADNDLMVLLDAAQLEIFKKQQLMKADTYEGIVSGMKKEGFQQADIDKKLAETEF